MRHCNKIKSLALVVLALIGLEVAVADASVYTVGELPPLGGDDFFSASWLHDASGARNVTSGTPENGAYRSGKVSGSIAGNLHGTVVDGKLMGIGGILSGNLSHLLKGIDDGLKNQSFTLKLGTTIGALSTGALKFNTDGTGPGGFTGGFIDYLLEVPGIPDFSLSGTFFFKPQAETGNSLLSPNRGSAEAFTLWGYNWMHDSGPINSNDPAASWDFLSAELGYDRASVNRVPFDAEHNTGHTLGIALFAGGQQAVENAAQPEPTALLIWGGLSMFAVAARRRA